MVNIKYYFIYETSIGKIAIYEENNNIIEVSLAPTYLDGIMIETDLIHETHKEIDEYLSGARNSFNVPIKIEGTIFQKLVLNELLNIPYGKTKSYKDIAILINKPNSYRAVGNACNKNKLPLLIPCHRIIGSTGKLVGYSGGLKVKKQLLELEKKC